MTKQQHTVHAPRNLGILTAVVLCHEQQSRLREWNQVLSDLTAEDQKCVGYRAAAFYFVLKSIQHHLFTDGLLLI